MLRMSVDTIAVPDSNWAASGMRRVGCLMVDVVSDVVPDVVPDVKVDVIGVAPLCFQR